jgi:hypothetical protein
VTVLAICEALAVLVATLVGVAVVVIELTTAVWVMVTEPLLPCEASVAVIEQLPTVADAL